MADVTVSTAIDKFLTGTALSSTEKAALRDALSTIADNDSRLSDARTPTGHAASHATGGADAITPASIGASAAGALYPADVVNSPTAGGVSVPGSAEQVKLLWQALTALEITDIDGLTDALNSLAGQVPAYIAGTYTITESAGVATPDAANGRSQKLPLTSDTTLELPTNLADGQSMTIAGTQAATPVVFNMDSAYQFYGAGVATDVTNLGAGAGFEIYIKRVGSTYRCGITTQQA